tara:strand:- start:2822 stop:3085 length:264 start_codon:yes stop_codon:yes gene_type:complete
MVKKFYVIIIFILIVSFAYFITITYLSELNRQKIFSNRQNLNEKTLSKINLITLKNDTNNVIEFNSGFNADKTNKPKRNFWDLISKP